MTVSLEIDGLRVEAGTCGDFGIYSDLQHTVMPVVSLQDGTMRCWGSAVCIGPRGWFLSAGHVVDDFLAEHGERDDGTTGLFIMWETNELIRPGTSDFLGAPLPVTYYHRHSEVDLVALTTKPPTVALDGLRAATLAFRMPELGEPLAVVGYRHIKMTGSVLPTKRSVVEYERILAVGVGEVCERQLERRGTGIRGSPGVVTDAPIHFGMSGGPVFDANQEVVAFASSSMPPATADDPWSSYVALCVPALELRFMVSEDEADEGSSVSLAELASRDAIHSEVYDGFDADEAGRAIYHFDGPT